MKLNLNTIDNTNIASIDTENSGGGNMLDFITLRNGQVLVVSDEYVGLYASKDAFYATEDQINGFYLKDAS
jgi:hypothetical protein